MNCNVTEFFY